MSEPVDGIDWLSLGLLLLLGLIGDGNLQQTRDRLLGRVLRRLRQKRLGLRVATDQRSASGLDREKDTRARGGCSCSSSSDRSDCAHSRGLSQSAHIEQFVLPVSIHSAGCLLRHCLDEIVRLRLSLN